MKTIQSSVEDNRKTKFNFFTTKPIFTFSLIIVAITILTVYVTGIKTHRDIINNSFISLSIISASFFLFITMGLFLGIKLKDNVGDLSKNIKWGHSGNGLVPDFSTKETGSVFFEIGEGLGEIFLSILLWIFVTILAILLIIFFETVVWSFLMIFLGMLYWIFFRALRMVFKNSFKCKNNFLRSLTYGLTYTTLYFSWFYGIILLAWLLK